MNIDAASKLIIETQFALFCDRIEKSFGERQITLQILDFILSHNPQNLDATSKYTFIITGFAEGSILISPDIQNRELILSWIENFQLKVELELSRKEEYFKTIVLDHLSEGVVACDENGVLRFFNEQTRAFHGLPEEPISPEQWANHYDLYSPDRKTLLKQEDIPLFRAFKGERVSDLPMIIAPRGREPLKILSNATPLFDKHGKKIGALATMRDETDLKRRLVKTESRFRTIFEQSPLSIQILSKDGRTLHVNPAWKKLWGIPEEIIQNFILKDYNLLTDPELAKQGVASYIRAGFEGHVTKIPIINYDAKEGLEGYVRKVEGLIFPLRNEHGDYEEVAVIHIDVTEREQLYVKAQEAILQRDEFISIASHELKTPITSMKLQFQFAERILARDENAVLDPAIVNRLVSTSNKQIDKITVLVEDMLDIARVTSGKLGISLQEANISELVENVSSRLQNEIEELGKNLTLNIQKNIFATCDIFRIEQVLTNLLTNATRYGNNRPVKVTLSADQKFVTIMVIDEGPGIALEDQERIFQRFERAISHNSISGLGLGLFISRQIMERHHGSLTVESSIGKGSKFIAVFPISQPIL